MNEPWWKTNTQNTMKEEPKNQCCETCRFDIRGYEICNKIDCLCHHPAPENNKDKMEEWEVEFRKLVLSLDDNVSFFPYGGDSYDFSEENCIKFIRNLIDKSKKEMKDKVLETIKDWEREKIDFGKNPNMNMLYNQILLGVQNFIADIKTKIEKEI